MWGSDLSSSPGYSVDQMCLTLPMHPAMQGSDLSSFSPGYSVGQMYLTLPVHPALWGPDLSSSQGYSVDQMYLTLPVAVQDHLTH